VSGAGSQWHNGDVLFVGSGGSGTLTINTNATVTAAQLLDVGEAAPGTVRVDGGAVLSSKAGSSSSGSSGIVGGSANGRGTILVSGAGSQWNQDGGLRVGFFGTGTMNISAGGAVNDAAASIGYQAGSNGTVQVTGGSVWNNTNNLAVGVGGSGTLTVGSGSLVGAGSYTQGSNGALNIKVEPKVAPGQISTSGAASLGGTLNIVRHRGFVPPIGSIFRILTAGSVLGTFSTVNGTSINSQEHFVVQYNSTNVVLLVAPGA
jgi:T5SS/PEP-CTERM-associated repeat protein